MGNVVRGEVMGENFSTLGLSAGYLRAGKSVRASEVGEDQLVGEGQELDQSSDVIGDIAGESKLIALRVINGVLASRDNINSDAIAVADRDGALAAQKIFQILVDLRSRVESAGNF